MLREVYIESFVRFYLEKQGYVAAEIIRCDAEPPVNEITRARAKGRPNLMFADGTCTALDWQPVEPAAKRRRR